MSEYNVDRWANNKSKNIIVNKGFTYKHADVIGDEVIVTEIEVVSQFDMLPRWLQWSLLAGMIVPVIIGYIALEVFKCCQP